MLAIPYRSPPRKGWNRPLVAVTWKRKNHKYMRPIRVVAATPGDRKFPCRNKESRIMKFVVFRGLMLLAMGATPVGADEVRLVAGGGKSVTGVPATEVKLNSPFGVDFNSSGVLFFVELNGHRVGRIDEKGQVTTLAGTGQKGYSGDGRPAAQAEINGPHNLAVSPNGDIFIADTWNNVIRKIDAKTGFISTVAGTGEKGYSGDGGPATKAKFGGIYCVTLDPSGERLFLADLDNRRIRVVELKSGIVRTVAGNGKRGQPSDGADAATSPLVDPRAVTADVHGNVYVLERGGHSLRIVDKAGKIRTVAGTGKAGLNGDGGPAREATFNGPKHLCIDRDGSILIADTENHAIRRYIPATGQLERVAGTGKKGTSGVGGSPLLVELNQPHGVYVHPSGDLYIADSSNNRILKIVRGK